jgi:hypothetical protein
MDYGKREFNIRVGCFRPELLTVIIDWYRRDKNTNMFQGAK